jgi:hypothetical protein
LVLVLILYLINLLPVDGRVKRICQIIVIVIAIDILKNRLRA